MRIWLSAGSDTVAVPLVVIAIFFLLFLELFQYGVEAEEPLRPEPLVVPDPVVDRLDRASVQPVQPLPADLADLDDADLAQHTQVLRHLRLSDSELAHQVVHRPLAVGEDGEDLAPSRL